MTAQGRVVELSCHGGERIEALLYEPEPLTEGRRAGLVLAHDVFGLEKPMQALAARLALEGFVIVAPDLWSRGDSPGPRWDQARPAPRWSEEEVRAGVGALADRRVLGDLEAARARLAREPGVDPERIGVVGVGHGGTFALLFACAARGIAAAALVGGRVHYPELSRAKPSQPLELALNLGCPLLAVFGEGDPAVSEGEIAALRESMTRFARELELVRVPSRALAAELRQERLSDGAERALAAVLSFLRERLGI